jgi:alkylated DNA repair dioxygenase AlkB
MNQINQYARQILRNERSRMDSNLRSDLEYLFDEGAIYIPQWLCSKTEQKYFDSIMKELDHAQVIQWSRHFKYENPQFSNTFNEIISKLSEYFQVDILATRLNYYPNGKSWKPFHHDSHAFSNGQQEDFTMGVSLGHSRKLAFKHSTTEEWFQFPQENGDVFAFNSEVNKRFMHGVPKTHESSGARISIIAWGKRKNPTTTLDPIPKPIRINRLKEKIATRKHSAVQSGWNAS